MSLTVSDLLNTFSANMKLIAGQGGLAREISSCGILDYELVPELRDKFYHTNFQNGQFILSSLLYAKDNPFLLSDAIKHLISKGVSGIAIRNVFKLKIPENVLRYADSQNFPILIIQSIELPFETIIYKIERHFELEKEDHNKKEILNFIYTQTLGPEEITEKALRLNPSFNNQYFSIFYKLEGFLSGMQKKGIIENFRQSNLFTYEDFICEFKKGILIVKSSENLHEYHNDDFIEKSVEEVFRDEPVLDIGVSDRHSTLSQFKQAILETLFASAFCVLKEKKYCYYSNIGIYKVIFPFCKKEDYLNYSYAIMKILEDYDTENYSNLVDTLITYVNFNFSKSMTAKKLSQHEQTIRYRINRIFSLTDLDHKSSADMEQLSIACKIYIANRILDN